MIQKAIAMTSKGTFTLPAKIRADLALSKKGQKLMVTYHPISKTVELTAAPNFAAIRDKLRPLAKNSTDFDLPKIREQHHKQRANKHLS